MDSIRGPASNKKFDTAFNRASKSSNKVVLKEEEGTTSSEKKKEKRRVTHIYYTF